MRPTLPPPRENVIKTLRIKKRMTQDQLAEKVGISASAVSLHENHQRHISAELEARYVKELGGCWKQL